MKQILPILFLLGTFTTNAQSFGYQGSKVAQEFFHDHVLEKKFFNTYDVKDNAHIYVIYSADDDIEYDFDYGGYGGVKVYEDDQPNMRIKLKGRSIPQGYRYEVFMQAGWSSIDGEWKKISVCECKTINDREVIREVSSCNNYRKASSKKYRTLSLPAPNYSKYEASKCEKYVMQLAFTCPVYETSLSDDLPSDIRRKYEKSFAELMKLYKKRF